MPRCQHTFRRLPTTSENKAGSWICPHCADGEVYSVVRDTDLLDYASIAENVACAEFGLPDDASRSTLLIYGLRPECVREADDRRYDIYLHSDSDPLQLRLQIGHEFFHRVCSQGRIFHWTHEMMACLFSVRLLKRQGFTEYAAQTERNYRIEAEACELKAFFNTDLWAMPVYPQGFYGRAYVVGEELEEAVGWPALCRLARVPLVAGGSRPDVERWIARLPEDTRNAALSVISG